MKKEVLLSKAIEKWGKNLQLIVAIEEMTELIKALIKDIRCIDKWGISSSIAEEIADVEIMLEQLKLIYQNSEAVKKQKTKKLDHLKELLI